uniref:NUDE domain-containing protein n=1 Tax=Timema douglasi TaxID=61478 RepID=A0A7R8VRL4_TIMDO|nr:unnamed protein product [Timema douglasi]
MRSYSSTRGEARLDDARDEKRQVERDLEEFQENSQQLEKELETSLEQAEKTTRDLRTRNNRLQLDNDTIRDKFEHLQRQSNMQILELQTSVSEYNNRQETLVKYIRELEQKNDDLERANRAMMTSLGESETKLNTAIERNAILEVEQDETKSILQRLKDESRDLLQEMKIRGPQVPDNDKSLERVCSPIDSNKLTVEIQTQTGIPGSPLKNPLLRRQNWKHWGSNPGLQELKSVNLTTIPQRLLDINYLLTLWYWEH